MPEQYKHMSYNHLACKADHGEDDLQSQRAAARTSPRGGGTGAGDGRRGRGRGGREGRGSRHFFIDFFGTCTDDKFREQTPFLVGPQMALVRK